MATLFPFISPPPECLAHEPHSPYRQRLPHFNMDILVITTGGTIDKVYFDATSEYEIGEPTIPHVFREAC